MNSPVIARAKASLVALKSPKLLAVGVPLVFLGQCAPNGCAPVPPASSALTVSHVVDGDTVDLSNGERVRLIGIDAPEAGSCGSVEATNALVGLVAGRAVTITTGARDDRDRYGRLLRYVEVAGTDAGRALIGQGLAIARYDSRDGYGAHVNEGDYMAADAATANFSCGTSAPVVAPPASNCETSYPDFCLTPGVDVDCGEIPHRNFTVYPPDPFRLDGNDNDGRGCEGS